MRYTSYTVNQWSRPALLLAVVGLVSGFVLLGQPANRALHTVMAAKARPASAEENAPIPLRSEVAAPDETTQQRLSETYGNLPLSFEVNQGQTDARVKFLSRGSGYNLFLTSTEAVLSLHRPRVGETSVHEDKGPDVVRMNLVAADPHARIEGLDQLPGKSNYFIGKNPRNWRTNVSTYQRVYYHEIYKGVDLVYYGNHRQLENDFVVAPGADPNVIALAFDGSKKITIDKDGNLLLQAGGGQVQLQRPVIYQLADGVRQEVAGTYVLKSSGDVGFAVAAYDHSRPLVIDPVLVYSSYLGGNGADGGNAIAVDDAGNAYITGATASSIFPTVSPIDSTLGGTADAFVVKINPAGSAIVYSTYLGGSTGETGIDIAVDGAQNVYVTGRTSSGDFPVVNAFDSTYSGTAGSGIEDAFVVRINPAGSALVYSTYLSGNFGARGCGIAAIGSQGFAYVTGTTSTNFPVTSSAFESTNFNSGFLTKLCTNCSGASSLVYSTFLAHTGSAAGQAIAADVAGNVYITGNVNSTTTNFATPGAFQTTFGGGSADAFVEEFNTNLSGAASRVYATYLGGSAKDIGGADGSLNPGKAIAIDASGNAYITGSTSSTNFPLANASQSTNGGQNDAFLTKLNAAGSALIYSTYLGGTGDDFGKSVAVNVGGGAYVTGVAGSSFPAVNPLPAPVGGCCPFGFVAKFTPSGAALVYSTTLSGVSNGSLGIALDLAGNAFATGSSNAQIVTFNPFQPTNGGGGTDGWVSVIADPTIIGRVSDENGNPLSGATVNLTGVPTATTTTDANGGYTFGLLTAGNSYTVSVVAPGYIFNPASVNNLQKNVRRDFGPVMVNISGQVTLNASGLSGVTITLSGGQSLSVQTNVTGNYSFSNLLAGRNYTVTPGSVGFRFTPPSSTFTNVSTNQVANFVASPVTAALGNYPNGTVQLSANTTIVPDAAPTGISRMGFLTSTNFQGNLAGDPTTGIVRVTDAHPAGIYPVTVTGFDSGGGTTTKTFTLTVSTVAVCNTVNFNVSTLGVNPLPYAVAVGDFNGDGKQDIVTANGNSNSLSVFLGNGTGGFGAGTNFPTGDYAVAVVVGDFNGDGNQDLATANYFSDNVSILLGNGAGNFSAATSFAVGDAPYSIAVGDFNGDGKQDLAVVNVGSNSVSILLGNGAGSFGATTNFPVAGSYSYGVAVGDFNGDGKQDLAVGGGYAENVSILLGNGAGGFSAATTFAVAFGPRSIAIGDFNGDGKQDLAISCVFSNVVSILLGNGAGSFGIATNFTVGDSPLSVAVGDFDGDGKQDLATANQFSNSASVLLGNGAGSFSAATNFVVGSRPGSVAIGDFNGDGKQDLVLTNISSGLSVLLRQCTSSLPTVQFSSSSYSVNEGAGSLNVTVTRTGDTSGPSSLYYSTRDTDTFTVGCSDTVNNMGGAYGRCDYSNRSDFLNFAAGETTKTIAIPIIDDALAEGSETFSIVLNNNVSGATLGSASTALITIIDNDTVTGPNPIFNTPFFVREQYLDFLSREPEAGEPWTAVLNNCSDVNNNPLCDRLTVSAAFFGSPEFQLKGYFVYRFYKLAFNRLPTYPEIVTDMGAVTGQTPAEVFQKKAAFTDAFTQRVEFATSYGALTDGAYVAALMGRYSLTQITTPDPAAPDGTNKVTLTTAQLTTQLGGGTLTRAQVLRAIADSDQVFNLEYNQAFVAMQYYGYLRRAPETAGYNAWLAYLIAHPTDSRTMVNGFMNSAEYRLRFGPP